MLNCLLYSSEKVLTLGPKTQVVMVVAVVVVGRQWQGVEEGEGEGAGRQYISNTALLLHPDGWR